MGKNDLILRNGMVIDPVNGVERVCDIAIKDGVVASVERDIDYSCANQVIDVSNRLVMPGIIDSHVHLTMSDSSAAGYRMLVRAGVTTAFEFMGPVNRIASELTSYGYGLNVGVLNAVIPKSGARVSREEAYDFVNKSIDLGAIGAKILGGHYPLEPETAKSIVEIANKEKVYVAYHAGSTNTRSDIIGMEEAVSIANGLHMHLPHINSYCRGMVKDPIEEVRKALELLKSSPNIVSESYLSPYNGTSGSIADNGMPESHITRNCLKMFGYEVNKEGLGKAIIDKVAAISMRIGEEMELIWGGDAYYKWLEADCNTEVCFSVNPSVSTIACVGSKNDEGKFIVDAISTDGGVIPRNFILTYGLALVRLGVLTLKELVWKASYMPAQMFGLVNKGCLSLGADADITVANPDTGKAYMTIIGGKVCMMNDYLVKRPGTLLTTERGSKFIKQTNTPFQVVDLAKSSFYKGRDAAYDIKG